MDAYGLWKVVHLVGITLVLAPVMALALHGMNGRTRDDNPKRRMVFLTHGVGMFVSIYAGMKLAVLTTPTPWPSWVWCKLLLWLLAGFLPALASRRPALGGLLWWAPPVFVAVAVFLVQSRLGA